MEEFRILEKKNIDGYNNFSLFDYLGKVSCITDFAIASGTFCFPNSDNVRAGNYWLNETDEMDPSRTLVVNFEGKYEHINKKEKYYVGIKPYGDYSELKNYITGEQIIDRDLSIGEMSYFPNKVSRISFNEKKFVNTGINYFLPIQNSNLFTTFGLIKTPIYEFNGKYFLRYPNQHYYSHLSNDDVYVSKEKILFELEPVRIWIDKSHDKILTQEIIIGGISYNTTFGPDEYDDYYKSDIHEALNIFENNIKAGMQLYDKPKVKRKIL